MKYTIDVPKETIEKIKARNIDALDCNEYNQFMYAMRNAVPTEDYSHIYESEE